MLNWLTEPQFSEVSLACSHREGIFLVPPDCLPKAGCGSLYGQFILLWRLLQLIEQLKAFSFPSFYPRYVGAALLIFTVCSFVSMCKHLKKRNL